MMKKLFSSPPFLTMLAFLLLWWLTALPLALAVFGSAFLILGCVGVQTMPDVYCRMHVLSKATSLGAAGVFLALATALHEPGDLTKILLALFFLFLTVPISSHAIGRAAYLNGFAWFREATVDEWGRFGTAPALRRRREEKRP